MTRAAGWPKTEQPSEQPSRSPSPTQVVALRLRPDEIAALDRFGRTIGCSAAQVLKLAGRMLADGRAAVTGDEVGVFRAVARELALARGAVERLEAALAEAEGFRLSALDEALARMIAALAAFQTSAELFADRRRSSLRAAVAAAALAGSDAGRRDE